MPKGPTARRYAQALFLLASEKNANQEWLVEIQEVRSAFEKKENKSFLSSPRVKKQGKNEVIDQLKSNFDALLLNFIGLLVARNSVNLLPEIEREYRSLLDSSLGRVSAKVTTAVKLSDRQVNHLSDGLGSSLQKEVIIEQDIDPDIIGGILIRVGDKIIDGSVHSKLESLKLKLLRESIV